MFLILSLSGICLEWSVYKYTVPFYTSQTIGKRLLGLGCCLFCITLSGQRRYTAREDAGKERSLVSGHSWTWSWRYGRRCYSWLSAEEFFSDIEVANLVYCSSSRHSSSRSLPTSGEFWERESSYPNLSTLSTGGIRINKLLDDFAVLPHSIQASGSWQAY